MKVIDIFSEATYGGWTMKVSSEENINVGDILYNSKHNIEFFVNVADYIRNCYFLWLSPNNRVPMIDIDDELIIIRKNNQI